MKRIFTLVVASLVLPTVVQADWTLGTSRANGMGAAGLAFPKDYLNNGKLNPAMYGLTPEGFKFQFPGLKFRLSGLTLSELQDFSGGISNGGLDASSLSELARTIGDGNTEFGLGLTMGFVFNGFALDFGGEALASTIPNAALSNWVKSGNQGVVPATAQLDGYGVGGYEMGFSLGRRFNTSGEMDMAFGVRAKVVRSFYTHRVADANTIANNTPGLLAPEMNGRNTLNESSFGLDVGVISSADKEKGLFLGATIDNLIEPNVSFDGTLPNGVQLNSIAKPYRRAFNIGAGYITPEKLVVAADFYDIFNGAGLMEFRSGLEYQVSDWFAVRSGYASRTGWTVGLGMGSINFAYSSNLPGQLGYSFRF